jgi:hypothetical protein
MTNIEFVDRPTAGWFVFDVMREKARTPNLTEYRSRDSAWDALEDLMVTRH